MSFPHDDKPLFGEFDPPKDGQHMLGSMQKITIPRRRFTDDEVLDFVIVGLGLPAASCCRGWLVPGLRL